MAFKNLMAPSDLCCFIARIKAKASWKALVSIASKPPTLERGRQLLSNAARDSIGTALALIVTYVTTAKMRYAALFFKKKKKAPAWSLAMRFIHNALLKCNTV